MSIVWVPTHRGDFDLGPAAQFGEVRVVVDGRPNVFATDALARLVARAVALSLPDDFLLPSGSAPLTALLAAGLALRHGKLNLLIFDPRADRYVPRLVTGEQLAARPEAPTGGQ